MDSIKIENNYFFLAMISQANSVLLIVKHKSLMNH